MLAVDEDQVVADLRALAGFGKLDTGVNRPAFTDADLAAREWLGRRMQAAGLDAVIDGMGNVYGEAPGADRTVLLGSHTDTVPNGGWLDGALGVIFGLEVVRAWRRTRSDDGVGVDLISFSDEEGTWLACLGSRSFCDMLTDAELARVRARTGERLLDRLAHAGLQNRPLVRLDPKRHSAYLEAHIEQGPRLASCAINIGVVTGIVGLRRYVVLFRGRADHAGTTPMETRRDAASALFAFANALADRLREAGGPESVWNYGIVAVRPGAANVVPAEAELTVEFRDLSPAIIERMDAAFHATVQASDGALGVAVSTTPDGSLEPTAMDESLIGAFAQAAAETGASHIRMPSGAGHDAMILARRIPSAMMFVPSIDGRSHDISEDTREDDIRRGLRVFAVAAEKILDDLKQTGRRAAAVSSGEKERAP
jgi:beta-ureidopropionase / N-carbamoyl-L-amino-acid hydrolase